MWGNLRSIKRGGRPNVRRLVAVGAIAALGFVLVPPLGSADYTNYSAYGHIANRGLDAYRVAVDFQLLAASICSGRRLGALRDQLDRASVSVVLNIAEGSGRFGPADKAHFYLIARGSAMECLAALSLLAGGDGGDEDEVGLLTALGGCYWNLAEARTSWRTLRRAIALAQERGLTSSQLALLWVKDQPGVTAPIIGPRTMAHLEDNLAVLDRQLAGEDRAALDAVNGPGGAISDFHNSNPWMKTRIAD